MPPPVALFLTFLFCSFMLYRESRQQPEVGTALWLPVVWMCIVAARPVSAWLALIGIGGGEGSLEDGSPLDALIYAILLAAGVWALRRREISVSQFVRANGWLAVFFFYCFLAITWSDFPFVALKRWVKILGHPIMGLIILTDQHREVAVRRVLKRTGYLLIPLNILFIKYYPQYGRGYDDWTGRAFNIGITLNKNELGYGCLMFGLFFFWNLLSAKRLARGKAKREEIILSLGFLGLIWWLLNQADSATSLACLLVGASIMVIVTSRFVSRKYLGIEIVVIALLAIGAETAFGVRAQVLDLLNRDSTLTGRADVWEAVLGLDTNPLLGAGFESFWLGERLDALWTIFPWRPVQAHNGYIEMYLNLGLVGVAIFVCLVIAVFRKARLDLVRGVDFGRFRFAMLVAILAYNYTEATFRGPHFVFTLFHLIAIDYPRPSEVAGGAARSVTTGGTLKSLPGGSPRFRTQPSEVAPLRVARTRDAVRLGRQSDEG